MEKMKLITEGITIFLDINVLMASDITLSTQFIMI